jgi:hypothetical protein
MLAVTLSFMTSIPALEIGTQSKIHLIGGEKGGVGKSLTARLLAQYFIDQQVPFVGFDTDRSHGALLRYYAGFASPVVVDRYEALDAIVESALEQPGRRVLVDLAAQTHGPLVKWMEESGVLNLAEESGLTVNYWHVMDAGRDSVDLLSRLLDQFGARLNYVLVRNQLRGDDFGQLDKSGEQARAVSLGAKVITLKRLHEPIAQKIDASNASFWSAKNNSASGLGLMERQRLKMWLNYAMGEIASVQV